MLPPKSENELVDEAIEEEGAWFEACKALKKEGKIAEAKEAETAYKNTKCMAKHAIWLAKSEADNTQMVMVLSILPNRWTAHTRTLLARTVYAMMLVNLRSLTMTSWKHRYSTMLGSSTLSSNGQAMSSLSPSLQPTPTPTPNQLALLPMCLWPRSAKHSARSYVMPFWHHRWYAESCWWGKSWAAEKISRGCFQKWYDPSRLGGELHPESL